MNGRPGKVAIFEQFAADGIEYMFGNPGTVEQGFLDAGGEFDVEYLLALHEGVAVGMADGYARASQRPALVQLHSGVGLGNGIGMLYQAKRGGSPLVVVVGEAGIRYDAMDGQMAADLVAMAEPVTKYATRVLDPSSTLRVLRRAIKIAMTPPRGPVLVVVPADVLDEITTEPVFPTPIPNTRVLPETSLVAEAATTLLAGRRRLVLMGDGVATSGAQGELTAVAEALDAKVWGVNSSEFNFDATHPLYGGQLGHMFGADSARVVAEADSVLIVGTYVFPEVFPSLASPFKPDAKIVHVDLDSYEIAKNHPVTVGIVADPKLTLAALGKELNRQRPNNTTPLDVPRGRPLHPEPSLQDDTVLDRFVRRLARRAPEDLVVFDEALTASAPLAKHLPPQQAGRFFQTRGGSLGVGIPGALGIKLARPESPVVAFTGDGGSMYTFQALWTAARYGIGAKFVICNNRRYHLLDLNIEQYWRELGMSPHNYPAAFDLSKPEIGFADMAAALGVPGRRVEKLYEVDSAVDAMLAHDGPYLIDLVID
ncbi:thiamine pyrophosphate-binding protein [Saccharothrix sp. ALI-22-I]|uniref:thiamine pyrophosphate-binding protein n=1 Tax=Saccharothrix sp. ALI-22-I TaxID=1933778 RepID=UPI00097C2075|nr:thiamine pyrophosphate-binding protein [Saccharothrix sp. ALI-22-I]ONI85478.1 thiamine pyrophosphate-binding protein [Saccharothrix sp. ALI-22-I]